MSRLPRAATVSDRWSSATTNRTFGRGASAAIRRHAASAARIRGTVDSLLERRDLLVLGGRPRDGDVRHLPGVVERPEPDPPGPVGGVLRLHDRRLHVVEEHGHRPVGYFPLDADLVPLVQAP